MNGQKKVVASLDANAISSVTNVGAQDILLVIAATKRNAVVEAVEEVAAEAAERIVVVAEVTVVAAAVAVNVIVAIVASLNHALLRAVVIVAIVPRKIKVEPLVEARAEVVIAAEARIVKRENAGVDPKIKI